MEQISSESGVSSTEVLTRLDGLESRLRPEVSGRAYSKVRNALRASLLTGVSLLAVGCGVEQGAGEPKAKIETIDKHQEFNFKKTISDCFHNEVHWNDDGGFIVHFGGQNFYEVPSGSVINLEQYLKDNLPSQDWGPGSKFDRAEKEMFFKDIKTQIGLIGHKVDHDQLPSDLVLLVKLMNN